MELTPQSGVAGYTVDESGEDGTNTDTSTSETDGGETGTLHLASSEDSSSRSLSNDATGLHGSADHRGGEGAALGEKQSITAGNWLASC